MTKSEQKYSNMADVCELAHKRTVRECKKKGITVDKYFDDDLMYTNKAQKIFNKHYDYICEVTGL